MIGASEAPVPETMEGLRRQNAAYRALCASLEELQADQTVKAREYREAVMTLDSEREANALLTAEIERLTVRLDDAYKALRSLAEGNLGNLPWQANYDTIRTVARNALPEEMRS